MEKRTFELFGEVIEYTLITEFRKNMKFRVYPDQTVEISAPHGNTPEEIQTKVEKRKRWIKKQQNYFDKFYGRKQQLDYESGETIKYLGRQYTLKVIESSTEDVKLKSGYLNLYTADPKDKQQIELNINDWWLRKAEKYFNNSLDNLYPKIEPYGISKPTIKIRKMEKRWGSCIQNKGIINLNPELLKTSKYCIEYVIMHELAHFKFANHSPEYYKFLGLLMPDWDERRYKLSKEGM